jgi:hypothetical protein
MAKLTIEAGKQSIELAVAGLVKRIQQYESDTFSASGSKLTGPESMAIAAQFIDRIADRLDGLALTEVLDEVRE